MVSLKQVPSLAAALQASPVPQVSPQGLAQGPVVEEAVPAHLQWVGPAVLVAATGEVEEEAAQP